MAGQSNRVSKKVMKVALAWMRDEMTTTEVQRQIKSKSVNGAVYRMGIAIRQAYRDKLFRPPV